MIYLHYVLLLQTLSMLNPSRSSASINYLPSDDNCKYQNNHKVAPKRLGKLRAIWHSLHPRRQSSSSTIIINNDILDNSNNDNSTCDTSDCPNPSVYFADDEHVNCNCRQFWQELDSIISRSHRIGRLHVQQRREIEQINNYSRQSLGLYFSSKQRYRNRHGSSSDIKMTLTPTMPPSSPTNTVYTINKASDGSNILTPVSMRKYSISTSSLSSIDTTSSLYSLSHDVSKTNKNYIFLTKC